MGQTPPEAADGIKQPPEFARFVFQPADEIQTSAASQTEVEIPPPTTATMAIFASLPLIVPPFEDSDATETSVLPQPVPLPQPALLIDTVPPPPHPAPAEALLEPETVRHEESPKFPLFQFGPDDEEEGKIPGDTTLDSPADASLGRPATKRRSNTDRLSPGGLAHFRQMIAQFQTFPASNADPTGRMHENLYALDAIRNLGGKPEGTLTWEDLDTLEIAFVRVLPEALLRSTAWSYRAHYFETAGPTLIALYLASRPRDWNDATVSADILRADLETLVSETQRNRVLPPKEDFEREYISEAAMKWALGLCLVGILGFVAARFVLAPSDAAPIMPFGTALLSGLVGGLLSLHSRLSRAVTPHLAQKDQVQAALEIPNFYSYPVQGALLAAIFYFLLIGGYLKGRFLPHADLTTLATPEGGARLIVWCFALGLLARFMPDLSKLLRRFRIPAAAGPNESNDHTGSPLSSGGP